MNSKENQVSNLLLIELMEYTLKKKLQSKKQNEKGAYKLSSDWKIQCIQVPLNNNICGGDG